MFLLPSQKNLHSHSHPTHPSPQYQLDHANKDKQNKIYPQGFSIDIYFESEDEPAPQVAEDAGGDVIVESPHEADEGEASEISPVAARTEVRERGQREREDRERTEERGRWGEGE